jgi:hypothetical protein
LVLAPVGQRRQELMQQITMSRVDLHGVEVEPGRAPSRIGKGIPHPRETALVQRRWGIFADIVRYGRGCLRLPSVRMIGWKLRAAFPGHLGGSFPPGMPKLNGNRHVGPAANAFQDPAHGSFAFIRIEADIPVSDPPFRHDRRCFDGQECGAGDRELAQMDQVPVVHAAVFGGILAHGRDHDAIGELKLPYPERREEFCCRHTLPPESRVMLQFGGLPSLKRTDCPKGLALVQSTSLDHLLSDSQSSS